MPNTPNRSTSEAQLNEWNQQLRASPLWQNWMRSMGKDRPGAGLNERERGEFERYLAQNGVKIPGGMHIDQGGNLNQDNRLWRNVGIGAAIGGGALTGFGLAGMGPLAGALGGAGAAGGAGAGGVLPSSAIPGLHAAVPSAIASQGASAGIGAAATGAGALAARHLATRDLMGGPPRIASEGVSRNIPWGGAADAGEDYLGGRDRPRERGTGRDGGRDGGRDRNPYIEAALAALAGLPALFAKDRPSPEEQALSEQAQQLAALQRQRIEHQNPLFSAVTQLAMSRLPVASQQPLSPLAPPEPPQRRPVPR